MIRYFLLIVLSIALAGALMSQSVGIGTTTPHASSLLDVTSTTKGLLIPRMTSAQRTAIAAPATGLLVYQTDGSTGFYYYDGTAWMYLQSNGSAWTTTGNTGTNPSVNFIGTTDAQDLILKVNNSLSGIIQYQAGVSVPNTSYGYQTFLNKSTSSGNNTSFGYQNMVNINGGFNTSVGIQNMFAVPGGSGHSNNALGYKALHRTYNGNHNVAIGNYALYENTNGSDNVSLGNESMYGSPGLSSGDKNVAVGFQALRDNVDKSELVAIGYKSLSKNSTGSPTSTEAVENTAVGSYALENNDKGFKNTAVGFKALNINSTGSYNTAVGELALEKNTSGKLNTAVGSSAMQENTTGDENTAVGRYALHNNQTGNFNTAVGLGALLHNTTGKENTATGIGTLFFNTIGNNNTALGAGSGYENQIGNYNVSIGCEAMKENKESRNTAVGYQSLYWNITGADNTALGYGAGLGTSGIVLSNCTFVGASTTPTQNRSNVTMLGAGITNAECTGDNQVLLGNTAVTQIRANVGSITTYSDRRYKNNIAEDVKGLDFINRLRPVSYTTNPEALHQIWGTPDSLLQKIDYSDAQNHRFTGLIAQEVEQAMKESGYASFTGIDIPKSDKETYTLRYTEFIMPLIKAVQELSEENRNLKKQTEILMAEREESKKLIDQYKMLEKKVESLLSKTETCYVQKK